MIKVDRLLAALFNVWDKFLEVSNVHKFIPKLRNSKGARSLINGINAGALAMMLVVTYKLGFEMLGDWQSITIFGLAD